MAARHGLTACIRSEVVGSVYEEDGSLPEATDSCSSLLSDSGLAPDLAVCIGWVTAAYEVLAPGGSGVETVLCTSEKRPPSSEVLASWAGVLYVFHLLLKSEYYHSFDADCTSDVADIARGTRRRFLGRSMPARGRLRWRLRDGLLNLVSRLMLIRLRVRLRWLKFRLSRFVFLRGLRFSHML